MRHGKTIIQSLLMFTFLIFCFIDCQDVARKPGAEIVFDEINHDFGQIEQGTVVTHIFNFENIGADTLKIARVLSS